MERIIGDQDSKVVNPDKALSSVFVKMRCSAQGRRQWFRCPATYRRSDTTCYGYLKLHCLQRKKCCLQFHAVTLYSLNLGVSLMGQYPTDEFQNFKWNPPFHPGCSPNLLQRIEETPKTHLGGTQAKLSLR